MTDYIEALTNAGGEVYVVGGAVRNHLYNRFNKTSIEIKDYDFLVRLLDMTELTNILKKYGTVKENIGEAFGITLFVPFDQYNKHKKHNEQIEFALPRTEESTGPGYKDFIIKADHTMTLLEDFSRRDATINAMAIRITKLTDLDNLNNLNLNELIDPFDGLTDIKNKIWRCVGDPNKRFVEDPNRIMRAFRQSAELNLSIETNSLNAIKNDYKLMQELIPKSYVRLFNELFRMINIKNNKMISNLEQMKTIGILDFLGLSNADTNINPTSNIVIKFAMLIRLHELDQSIKKWGNLRQITATNYFTPTDMITIVSIQEFYKDMINVNSLYQMLKILEKIYKMSNTNYYAIAKNIISYISELKFISPEIESKLNDYLTNSKNYPPNIDKLVLDGNILMTKWNIKGPEIKKTKELLLDLIFNNVLTNDLDCLESYLNKIIAK